MGKQTIIEEGIRVLAEAILAASDVDGSDPLETLDQLDLRDLVETKMSEVY